MQPTRPNWSSQINYQNVLSLTKQIQQTTHAHTTDVNNGIKNEQDEATPTQIKHVYAIQKVHAYYRQKY